MASMLRPRFAPAFRAASQSIGALRPRGPACLSRISADPASPAPRSAAPVPKNAGTVGIARASESRKSSAAAASAAMKVRSMTARDFPAAGDAGIGRASDSSSSTGRRSSLCAPHQTAASPVASPQARPPSSAGTLTCSQRADVSTAPTHQVRSPCIIPAAYSMPSGTPASAPATTSTAHSANTTRRTSGARNPAASRMPVSAVRRSTESRINMPASAAPAMTMKKLIDTNSTPKSVEPFDAARASARTGRQTSPASSARNLSRNACENLSLNAASSSPCGGMTWTPVTQRSVRDSLHIDRTVSTDTNAFGAARYFCQYASSRHVTRFWSIGNGGCHLLIASASVIPSKSGTRPGSIRSISPRSTSDMVLVLYVPSGEGTG